MSAVDVLAVPCRFRDPMLRKAFIEAVDAYRAKSSALFGADGNPSRLNSAACMFWRGFQDEAGGGFYAKSDKATFAFAYWKAGKAVRAALARCKGEPA